MNTVATFYHWFVFAGAVLALGGFAWLVLADRRSHASTPETRK